MSYICYLSSKNGIALLSDSRSTLPYSIKSQFVENDNTKKIFRGDGYLIAAFQTNVLYRSGIWIPLADVIEAECRKTPVGKFMGSMFELLKESFTEDKSINYSFLLAYIDTDNSPILEEWKVQENGMNRTTKNIGPTVYHLKNDFVDIGKPNPNWSVDEMVKIGKEMVNSVMCFNDIFLTYNPVGGPMQIETLEIQKNKGK